MGVKWLHGNSDLKLAIFEMKSNDVNIFQETNQIYLHSSASRNLSVIPY